MKKLRTWLRHEIDAELYACIYAACLIWLAAFFRFLVGADGLGLWVITEMIVLGWAVAWGQKLLYWGDAVGHRWDALRGILWWAAPAAAIWAAQASFGWFAGCSAWVGSAFSAVMAATLLAWWGCVRWICRDESREWNTLLAQFRAREQGGVRPGARADVPPDAQTEQEDKHNDLS